MCYLNLIKRNKVNIRKTENEKAKTVFNTNRKKEKTKQFRPQEKIKNNLNVIKVKIKFLEQQTNLLLHKYYTINN